MGSINIIKAVCMSAVSIAAYIKVRQCWFNNKKKPLMQPNQEEDDNDLRLNLIKPRVNFVNRIPRDIIELILSKVDDIVTLYSCSIVSRELYDIVTRMRVLCFTMPRSLISYPKAAPPFFAVIYSRFPKGLVAREVDRCMLSMNQKKSCDFFTRFSLLKSVVVQLPPPPTPLRAPNNSNSWFRWDSEINVTSHLSRYYFISVDATIVDKNNNQSSPMDIWPVRGEEIRRRGYVAWRHLKLHANTVLTHFPSMKINPSGKAVYHHPMLRTIVSKDDNTTSKGRLTLYKINEEDVDEDELLYKLEYRCKMCYLYNELELKSSGVTIKDAWLWFYYYDKDREDGDGDDDFSIKLHEDDLIMSCLNKGDYSRDELKEAVTKILGHINTFHFSPLGIVQSKNIMAKLNKIK